MSAIRAVVFVRRLEAGEVDLHRRLRLRAMREAPDSFGESFAESAARPWSYWEDLTRAVTGAAGQVMVLACEVEHVVGAAYGLRDRDRPDGGRVGGMWVDPAWRRRGLGRMLLDAVFGWARETGLTRLGLWAPAHGPAALALYRGAGFRETGRRRPLRADSVLEVVEMNAEVGAATC